MWIDAENKLPRRIRAIYRAGPPVRATTWISPIGKSILRFSAEAFSSPLALSAKRMEFKPMPGVKPAAKTGKPDTYHAAGIAGVTRCPTTGNRHARYATMRDLVAWHTGMR